MSIQQPVWMWVCYGGGSMCVLGQDVWRSAGRARDRVDNTGECRCHGEHPCCHGDTR